MTGRQRQLAAIAHNVPDRIPVDYICVDDPAPVMKAAGRDDDDIDNLLGRDGRVICAWDYAGPTGTDADGKPQDLWGFEGRYDYGTTHDYPLASATSVKQVEQFAWPDAKLFRDYPTVRASALAWNRQYAVRGPYWISAPLFCTTCNLFGMEEAMVKMMQEPDVFEACVEQVMTFSEEYVRLFVDAMGDALDILHLCDDFASQRGLMFDPALWRRYFKPRYARLFEIGKSRGLPVWFHSCGDVTPVLENLIEIGMDVWETVQLHALPISPQELKRQYGRHVTFFGAINTQRLPFAGEQQVRAEVRQVCDALGEQGGFICGPDHHVKPDVPTANTLALFDEATHFRRPGYTL